MLTEIFEQLLNAVQATNINQTQTRKPVFVVCEYEFFSALYIVLQCINSGVRACLYVFRRSWIESLRYSSFYCVQVHCYLDYSVLQSSYLKQAP